MAWMRWGLTSLALTALMFSGCTGTKNSWKSGNKVEGPPVAMQPVSVGEVPEESPAAAASLPSDEDAATAPTENADKVLAYLERLPDGSERQVQPSPAPTPSPAPPSAPSASQNTILPPAASTNAPISIAPSKESSDAEGSSPAQRKARAAPAVAAVRIKSASPMDVAEKDSRTVSTNEPLDSTAAIREMTLSRYASRLEEELKKAPSDMDAQWKLSALRLAMGDDAKALELSPEIAQEPAGVLRDSVQFFAEVRRMLTDPSQTADSTLAQLEALRGKLRNQAELEIPVVALCTRVMTFGVYDEMPADQLVAYQSNRTIVYSEIRNFASRTNEEGKFETMLSGRLELLTKDGRSLWQHEEPQIKDVSKQRRGDFFLAQLVSLPPDLAPGDYVLKVMIQDTLAGKANEGRMEFAVKGTQLTRK